MTQDNPKSTFSLDFLVKASIIIFLWATPALVSREFVGNQMNYPGLFFGFLRYLLGCLSLFMVIMFRRNIKQIYNIFVENLVGILICACWLVLMIIGQNFSIFFILGSSSSVLLNFNPVIVYLIAPLMFLDEHYTRVQSIAAIISSVGIVFVFLAANDLLITNLGDFIIGNALGFLSGAAWAGYTLTLKKIFTGESSEEVTATILSVAAVILFITSLLFEKFPSKNAITFDSTIGLLIIGVGAAGIAFTLYLQLIQRYGATRSANIQFLIPIVSILLAWIFLNEFSLLAVIGGIICAIGVAIVTNQPEKIEKKEEKRKLENQY